MYFILGNISVLGIGTGNCCHDILDTPIAVGAASVLEIALAIAKTYSFRSIKDLVIENATIHKNNK